MKEPVNVLLVSYEFPPDMAIGGIGSYMHHLAILLNNHHFKVTVFSATLQSENVNLVEREHGKNYLIPAENLALFRERALQLFKELNGSEIFDVMESPEVGACALEIKKEFPHVPLIVRMHTPGVLITKINRTYQPLLAKFRYVASSLKMGKLDLGYWRKKALKKEGDLEYQICKLSDALISPSRALKEWAESFWSLSKKNIRVIPNPFTLNENLLKASVNPRKKQICFVGKLSILKGMLAFTEAIPLILKKYPGYFIVLVGRDEVENNTSMKAWMQAQLHPFSQQIVFTGILTSSALENIYTESSIAIFPSLWENYPTVLLEAMTAGLPVAASNRGGIPEIIENNAYGELFNPMNPVAIFKAVDRLLKNESHRIAVAENARRRVIEIQNELAQNQTLPQLFEGLANRK